MQYTQFYVNDALIDLSRSLIVKPEQEIAIEPKILKVLALLAEHSGEVVTHQVIKQAIWPNVEVVPNALQRCIAQLRKALDDDAKTQAVIATHPKIGYRLIASVRVPDPEPSQISDQSESAVSESDSLNNPQTAARQTPASIAARIIALIVLLILMFSWPDMTSDTGSDDSRQFTQIRQLTQQDGNESQPVFSPNGEYLVFTRSVGLCHSQIWAKNMTTGKETLLTGEPTRYELPTFSADGNTVVMAMQQGCTVNVETPVCWSVGELNFTAALTGQSSITTRMPCTDSLISHVRHLDNQHYSFIQLIDKRFRLMKLDGDTQIAKTFYRDDNRRIYFYDFDPGKQQFAVISRDADRRDWLTLLNHEGMILSDQLIQTSGTISQFHYVEPFFAPDGDRLLFANASGAFELSLSGKITAITLPEPDIGSLRINPLANTLIGVRGHIDSDISYIDLTRPDTQVSRAARFDQAFQPYPSIARSSAVERFAKFRPGSNDIAFVSNRSGIYQVWLLQQPNTPNEQLTQLSQFSNTDNLHDLQWSPDGKQIITVHHDKLVLLQLDGSVKNVTPDLPVLDVLHWSDANTVLVNSNTKKVRELFSLDLTTGNMTSLGPDNVRQSWLIADTLFVVTKQKQLLRYDDSSEQPVVLSDNINQALITDTAAYWVTHKNLIRFDLAEQKTTTLLTLKENATVLSDIRGNALLLTQYIAANNELVEIF